VRKIDSLYLGKKWAISLVFLPLIVHCSEIFKFLNFQLGTLGTGFNNVLKSLLN
jgi:hypothetical protein